MSTSKILGMKPGQFSTVTGRPLSTLLSDRHRGISASAWGALEPPLAALTFMDAIAVLLVERLRDEHGLERKYGSAIVRVFADKWMEACAKIEHDDFDHAIDRDGPVYFMLTLVDPSKGIMRADAALTSDLPKLPDLVRLYSGNNNFQILFLNLRELLQHVRTRAEDALMELSLGTMFYPPDHPGFVAWKKSHREWAADILAQAKPERQRRLPKAEREAFEADLVRARQ